MLPVLSGIGLALRAERLFTRAGTGVRPFTPSTALVTGGPYLFTRNPMYLGMVLILAGVALICGSLAGCLVAPLFVWLTDRRFVEREEDHLERAFGQDYLLFKARVLRWL